MSEPFLRFLPSAVVLGAAAMVALFLTLTRGWAAECGRYVRGAVQVALVATLFQAVHFTEELATGFHQRLPALFGLGPISVPVFVAFNVGWLVVWGLSVWGLAGRYRLALFPLWFLAIGSITNGVAHPLLSVWAGGYFPGVLTSPVVGVLGIVLLKRLRMVTSRTAGVGCG